MPINDKILEFAFKSAFNEINQTLPSLSKIISEYTNWKHEDLKKAFQIISDIEEIIINDGKEKKIMGLDLRIIPVYLKMELISADNNEQAYEKFNKLLNDVKELLKWNGIQI